MSRVGLYVSFPERTYKILEELEKELGTTKSACIRLAMNLAIDLAPLYSAYLKETDEKVKERIREIIINKLASHKDFLQALFTVLKEVEER